MNNQIVVKLNGKVVGQLSLRAGQTAENLGTMMVACTIAVLDLDPLTAEVCWDYAK